MQLIYRGNTYSYDPTQFTRRPFQPVTQLGSAYTLTTRGTTYQIDPQQVHPTTLPASYELICRGNIYQVTETTAGDRVINRIDRDLLKPIKQTRRRLSLKLSGARS
jgi:hypothetical protein